MAVYDGYIYGKTIRFRSVEERDAEVTHDMRMDPERARFVRPMKGTASVDDQRAFVKKQREIPFDYLFLVEDLAGNPIGMKGVYNYDQGQNMVETGRYLGFGTPVQNVESLKMGFDFAFEHLNVDKVIMSALENNPRMLSLQKRIGTEYAYRDRYAELEFDSIYSILTKEKYAVTKREIEKIIDRFCNRK